MYQALVLVHIIGVVVFAIAHGVSMFTVFRVRRETDPRVVAALLGLSKSAVALLYVGLIVLLVGGLGAAWHANLLLSPWAIASYVVLIVVIAVMGIVATPYYVRLRELVGGEGSATLDAAELHEALDTRRPELLAIVGSVGLLVLLWLMVMRPG
ncbi:MAG TPA: DUF2269 family protein [Candidatus Limnocylindrales bacterium]|jgi:hypothetical protein|nr:DUF2269 family protein [Candidatus Limnocylindrales bacterium]